MEVMYPNPWGFGSAVNTGGISGSRALVPYAHAGQGTMVGSGGTGLGIRGALRALPIGSLYGIGEMGAAQKNEMDQAYDFATRRGLNLEDYITQEGTRTAIDPSLWANPDITMPQGVAPFAQEQIQETVDPYTGRSMRDISGEIGEYGDKPGEGFNEAMFYQEPGMWDRFKTPVMAGLEWLGDKFQRPEAKQKEFEMYEQTKGPQGWGDFGDYKGNIWEGSGGNKINVVDPVTGATILQNKNFDSMFGSDSVEEMIAKKEAWARKRRAKGEEYLSKELNAWLDAIDQGKGGTGDGSPQGGPDRTYGGPPTKSWNPNITSKPTHMGAGPLHGVTTSSRTPHHSRAQGGYMRSRYNRGGRVGILAAF